MSLVEQLPYRYKIFRNRLVQCLIKFLTLFWSLFFPLSYLRGQELNNISDNFQQQFIVSGPFFNFSIVMFSQLRSLSLDFFLSDPSKIHHVLVVVQFVCFQPNNIMELNNAPSYCPNELIRKTFEIQLQIIYHWFCAGLCLFIFYIVCWGLCLNSSVL